MEKKNSQKNEYTFEEAMARLEQLVQKLEEGETTLDQAITLFEEGIRLSEICSRRLSEAEQKVIKLSTPAEQ